jgi:mannosyltransferase OCH1-like enzyme
MIPKKLHYCWFGKNRKSELIEFCIESWSRTNPEFEILEWNEGNSEFENFPNSVIQAVYEQKWAFVSDYVRAKVLYEIGGIYLDTDVEIKRSLNRFLLHRAFCCFENEGLPFSALWGSEKNHVWPKMVLEKYHEESYDIFMQTNTQLVTQILSSNFGVEINKNQMQKLDNGIVIYPSNFFTLDLPDNYATHHFANSWKDERNTSYKNNLLIDFYIQELLTRKSLKKILINLIKKWISKKI